jgi:flagellum-specific peptidoglycan hydrolase FlgJ
MRFNSLGGTSDYSRAGKAVADDSIRAFAAARRNSPNYGKMVQDAAKIRSKEKMAMTKIQTEVAKKGIAVNADVATEKMKIDAEETVRKGKRKAGVLGAAGKFFAAAGASAGEKRTRREVGASDSFYDKAIKDAENRTNNFISQLNSGSDGGGSNQSPPKADGGDSSNTAQPSAPSNNGGGGGSSPTSFKGVMAMAQKAGAKHPELVAAQWALESGYGSTPSGKNNFFGQKTNSGGTNKGTWEVVNGQEVNTSANFMDFETPQDSVNYLVNRWHNDYEGYSGVNRGATADEAAGLLTTEGYATDPAYADKLRRIMRENGF